MLLAGSSRRVPKKEKLLLKTTLGIDSEVNFLIVKMGS